MTGQQEHFDLIVRGRLALPGREPAPGLLGVVGGRIAAVARYDAPLAGAAELDAGEAIVLPGVVDVHVHTRSFAGEGIEAATRAAAAGGVTTIVDMPYDADGMVADPDAFAAKAADVEREALVDVGLWATVPPHGPLEHVAELVRAGACGFKLSTFETDPVRFPRIPDDQLYAAFRAVAAAGGLVGVHSENDEIVRALVAAERAAGRVDPLAHARSRPPVAETEAIARCLELAHATGVRLHLCHVTLGRGVELARRARGDSVDVSAETCPHYLVLDESDLERRGGEAKINPPLRPQAAVEALWRALEGGELRIVSSDHVGWPAERKQGDDIFALSSGAPGLEVELPLLHDAFRARGLPLALLTHVTAEAPARRFGLWPAKGALRVGADADLVLLDPDERWTVDPEQLVTPAGWSPYAGRVLRGRVREVLARGETIFRDGRVIAAPGRGAFLPAAAREPVRA
ncbi:MAG TPA: amidohydrolase family protein [Gaiellaceae bacterium]|nr:amidohydrolase family protein [Gaiellaceae bacterium]